MMRGESLPDNHSPRIAEQLFTDDLDRRGQVEREKLLTKEERSVADGDDAFVRA